jgi:hypothetical protein
MSHKDSGEPSGNRKIQDETAVSSTGYRTPNQTAGFRSVTGELGAQEHQAKQLG